jgi:hypothetical protein
MIQPRTRRPAGLTFQGATAERPGRVTGAHPPSTRAEATALLTARADSNVDVRGRELGAAFLHAAREGIAFKMQTPRESKDLREELEKLPVQRVKFQRF